MSTIRSSWHCRYLDGRLDDSIVRKSVHSFPRRIYAGKYAKSTIYSWINTKIASYAFLGGYFYAWNTESLETKGVQKYDCAPKLCPKSLFFACFLAFLVRFSSWFWVNYAFMQRKNAFLWIKMRFWWSKSNLNRTKKKNGWILYSTASFDLE